MRSAHPSRRRSAAALTLAALALWLFALLTACGGFGDDRTKAQVRLVNAADSQAYPALQLTVDGALRQGNVAPGETAAYAEVDPDKTPSAISAAGSPTALLSFTPSLTRNRHYTVLAFGGAGALRQLLVDDNAAEPAANRTSLRVINAAPDAGSLDVYLTAAGDSLDTAVAARAGAVYGELSPVLDVASGTWRLRVAASNSKTDVRLDVPAVALDSRQVATLVLTPSRGGALVNALLVVQQGAIARADGTQARVRVLAGVADSATVTATLGGTALISAVGSPALNGYALVPAGAPALAISVNGNTVAAPAASLVAGGDYTLLVHGAAATPAAAWITDDNRPPTVSDTVRVRLVNATAGIAGALSMTVDALPVASGVATATASAYGSADASEVAAISVTAAGMAQAVFSATNQRLTAGSVYSVFVVGPQGSTTGIVRKDR
ncbi:MAG: DUF4397 domain-containing protein [Rubrivivax sp.]|nr:DUF4397 domain-containing protein [Rubrivivax sp.]